METETAIAMTRMKPQIISYRQNAWGITATHTGGTRLQVRVAALWQPKWWHCGKHPASSECCWIETGSEWGGIVSLSASGELMADQEMSVWMMSVADEPSREAATGLLKDELARLSDAVVVIHRQRGG